MLKYISKRLLMLIPVILGITFIIYFVLSVAPGDPAAMVLGADATAEELALKRAEMGLDRPIIIQYIDYLLGVFRGDFGVSWLSGYNVLGEFLSRMPNTIALGMLAVCFSVCIGIPFGILAAIKQFHPVDYATLACAMILSSLPAFWFGMIGQIIFCMELKWLPTSGVGSFSHFVLPALTLGAANLAAQMRIARTSMLDVLKQDYVRTARSKGAPEIRVIFKHVLRNGMLPVITQVGLNVASAIGGSVVTEAVFAIPGIGSLLVNAVKSRDIPIVMGTLIFVATFVGLINLLVDIIYSFVDPRVKLV